MIVQEIIEDYTTLVRTYSDKELKIRKIGTDEIYDEAIDPQVFHRQYEETDIPIDDDAPGSSGNVRQQLLLRRDVQRLHVAYGGAGTACDKTRAHLLQQDVRRLHVA